MKTKALTIILCLLSILLLNAQQKSLIPYLQEAPKATTNQQHSAPLTAKNSVTGKEDLKKNHTSRPDEDLSANSSNARSTTTLQVGTSTYDLQTNISMPRRILLDEDGTAHIVWTFSNSYADSFGERGTAYNTVTADGTVGTFPDARIEDNRTGWPNIGLTADNRLFSISHLADATASFGGLNWIYKDPEQDWQYEVLESVGDENDTWARIGVSGNTIHLIAGRSSNDGESVCGLLGGIAYYRSQDGGDTWENMPCITDMDSEHFPRISGDGYAIDVNGDNIAFVTGPFQPTLFKSIDGGDNWTSEVVKEIDIPLYDVTSTTELPVTVTSDESYSIIIDDNGVVHIWYGRVAITNDGTTSSWYPANNGIMYWNDAFPADKEPEVIGKTVRFDGTGDDVFDLDFETYDPNLYFNNQVSVPSAGIDSEGNLYVCYSSIMENAEYVAEPAAYLRDVLLIKSEDGGQTWIGPLNVSDDPATADMYASMARTVDGSVHLVYQSDPFPGHSIQTNYTHEIVENQILYAKIPTEDIVDPSPDFNTNPQLTNISASYGFQNCVYTADNLTYLCIDYPDGALEVTFSGSMLTEDDMPAAPGTGYNLTVMATDSDGNISEDTYEDMLVTEDLTAPFIVAQPYDLIETEEGTFIEELFPLFENFCVLQYSEYTDLGASIFDDSDPYGCPAILETANSVDTEVVGSYEVVYSGYDINGNEAETVTRYVQVIAEDLEAPSLNIYASDGTLYEDGDEITIEAQVSGTWNPLDYIAYDCVDGIITEEVIISGEVDITALDSYDVTYTVSDAHENTTTVTVTIKVIDTTPPQISFGSSTLVLVCEQEFAPAPVAFDNIDGDLSSQVVYEYSQGGICYDQLCNTMAGTYMVTYQVADASNNFTTVNQTIIITEPCDIAACTPLPECILGIADGTLATLTATVDLYPNPANNVINLLLTCNDLSDCPPAFKGSIYSIDGRLMQTLSLQHQQTLTLDVSNFTTGIYFLNVTSEKGTYTQKIVVNH